MAMTRKRSMKKMMKKSRKASRKGSKKSPWMEHVMKTFREMRKTDKHCSLGDAMKKAKATKNQM